MSYTDRRQQYLQRYLNNAPYLGDPSQNDLSIPADQSQNIFHDKMNQYLDQQLIGATAPATALGSAHLAGTIGKAILNRSPTVQKLKNLYNTSEEFRGKLGDLLGEDNLQNFLDNPQEALNKLSEPAQNNVLQTISDGINSLKNRLGPAAENLASDAPGLADSIPTADNVQDFVKGLARSAGQGAREGIFGIGPQAPTTEQAEPEMDEDTAELQRLFDAHEAGVSNQTGGAEQSLEDASKNLIQPGDDEFRDAIEQDTLPDDIREVMEINRNNKATMNALLDKYINNPSEAAGTGEQLDAQRAAGEVGGGGGEEASELNQLSGTQTSIAATQEEENATQDALNAAEGVGEGGAVGAEEGGEELAERGIASGVGDLIPGIGIAIDLATIGGIIGESVKSYNDKKKLASDEAKEQARESDLQQQMTNEQSQIIGQARQAGPPQTVVNVTQPNIVPVSQSVMDK